METREEFKPHEVWYRIRGDWFKASSFELFTSALRYAGSGISRTGPVDRIEIRNKWTGEVDRTVWAKGWNMVDNAPA